MAMAEQGVVIGLVDDFLRFLRARRLVALTVGEIEKQRISLSVIQFFTRSPRAFTAAVA